MIAPYEPYNHKEWCKENKDYPSCKKYYFMNKILPYIAGGIAFLTVLFLVFRKKKRKPAKRRTRRATASRSSSSSPKRKKKGTTGSRIKKEAGLTTSKPYAEMNARQKQLFNLAKARLARKKTKK